MTYISKLLRKNTPLSRIALFAVSNFTGLAIIACGLQFWLDGRSLFSDSGGFLNNDWLVVNKQVTSGNIWEGKPVFSEEEIRQLKSQPWVRDAGVFSSADYNIEASVSTGNRGMRTMMFFESVPDGFTDIDTPQWHYTPGDSFVPVTLSKDYLALYNFGFASSAGLPQISENMMGAVPLHFSLSSKDGERRMEIEGRVVGFSNRLNTILVPQSFMDYTNESLGQKSTPPQPSRMIIDVSSPGDVRIKEYLADNGLELAGDKTSSQAAFLLKVVAGGIVAVGSVITLLSILVLFLSVSLIMEKNRSKIHTLLMLGYDVGKVAAPYTAVTIASIAAATLFAMGASLLLRGFYMHPLAALGATTASGLPAIIVTLSLGIIISSANTLYIRHRISNNWRFDKA